MSTRISLFVPSLCGGGAERTIVSLARNFAERGLSVDLVLAKAEGPYLAEVPLSVRVVDLRAGRVLTSLPGLVRYLRQEKPNALLSTLDHANVIALLARNLSRVPMRAVIRVANTLSVNSANSPTLREKFVLRLALRYYREADAIVAISRGVADDLVNFAGLPKEKVQVIYNPTVTPALFAKAEELPNHPWFAPDAPPVILGVGRLTAQKDFPTLISAFALVRKKCHLRLMILGEGEERYSLEALVRELELEKYVSLPGFVENPYKYMKRAAVFVLSSRWEGFGNVLVEAMAIGTPVVSTDCPSGPAEILGDGRWGRLVSVGNVNSLAKAILETIGESRGKAIGRVTEFRLDGVAEQYAEVLRVTENLSVLAT